MKKLCISLLLLMSYANADDLKTLILKQEALDYNHIEPLTLSTYKELVDAHNKQGCMCIVARVASRGNNSYNVQYLDAGKLNRKIFKGNLYPEVQTTSSKHYYLNPLNNEPIIEQIQYLSLNNNGGAYLGSESDLVAQTPQGEYLRALLDAHYHTNAAKKADACLALATVLDTGDGVAQDKAHAHVWYKRAVEQDHNIPAQAQAALALARAHAHGGNGFVKNGVQALAYYQKAADQQVDMLASAQAALDMAEMYRLGNGVSCNMKKAVDCYKRAEAAQYPEVQVLAKLGLAEIYRVGGQGVKKDFAQASALYGAGINNQKNPAAHAVAAHGLAEIHHLGGFGLERDFATAAQYYQQAASQTHNKEIQAIAQAGLGEVNRFGGFGIERNPAQAAEWYQKAAEQNVHLASHNHGNVGLAELYRTGEQGVAHDPAKAFELYNKVANCTGDDCVRAVACNGLGCLYQQGSSVTPKDIKQALTWYGKAAEQKKDLRAQAIAHKNLADIYRMGDGIARDMMHATQLYLQAAQQEVDMQVSINAQEALGDIYWHGEGGIQKDLGKAIDHYTHVVEQTVNKPAQQRAQVALKEIKKMMASLTSKTDKALKKV